MTTDRDRPARHAIYNELMWPKYNQTTESYGVTQERAYALLDAHAAEVRAESTEQPAAASALAETDEQRADREETERDHAAGDHTYCGVTCETEFPSESMRNAILARAIPGSASMLDELLRRARAEVDQMREQYRAGLRHADEINNQLMAEVQRYADGKERPVLWSVYNEMHKRASTAEGKLKQLRADAVELRRLAAEVQQP